MTLDSLIAALQEARQRIPGDSPVMIEPLLDETPRVELLGRSRVMGIITIEPSAEGSEREVVLA